MRKPKHCLWRIPHGAGLEFFADSQHQLASHVSESSLMYDFHLPVGQMSYEIEKNCPPPQVLPKLQICEQRNDFFLVKFTAFGGDFLYGKITDTVP